MTRRTRTTALAASAVAVALTGALAAGVPAGAAPAPAADGPSTYRTVSGTSLCPPAGAGDCFSTLVAPDFNGARVGPGPVIVQTGRLPGSGPGLPVSLLTGPAGDISGTGGQQGFHWRVLDQNGKVSTAEVLAYFHVSAPFTDAGRTAREALVTTDAGGNARVAFVGTLATASVAVIATGRAPYTGPGLPANLVTSAYSRTGFTVRALDQGGRPIVNSAIRIHYWATAQTATPNTRAGQATVTPDAAGNATIPWAQFDRGLPAVSVVLTGTSPLSGPSMPVNLLAVTARSNGVSIRILDQSGRPVTTPVRIAYYATKASASVS